MLALCIRYCGNRQDAEDVLQEGFIRVFDHLADFRNEGPFDGWIRRIFVNTALSSIHKSLQYESEPIDDIDIEPQDNSLIDHHSAQEIYDQIAKLPNGYRTIFNLFAIEGFSHSEIAAMLQVSEATSRSQFFKARRALRLKLSNKEVSIP